MKKIEMVLGGLEFLAAVGVSTLVGSALGSVTPAKMGIIKKLGVSIAGVAISFMAQEVVTSYMDKQFKEILGQFRDVFKKKSKEDTNEEKIEEVSSH
jgi:hypothetical protein